VVLAIQDNLASEDILLAVVVGIQVAISQEDGLEFNEQLWELQPLLGLPSLQELAIVHQRQVLSLL
jgi:hypothetical protein